MLHLVSSVREAVANRNWYASLGLSLALPDICGFLESPASGSQKRYVAWCNRDLVPKYTAAVGAQRKVHVFLSGEDCYALRCAFLHEGADDIVRQRARKALDTFDFVAPRPGIVMHMNQLVNKLQLQIDMFCEDVCQAAESWWAASATSPDLQARAAELLMVR